MVRAEKDILADQSQGKGIRIAKTSSMLLSVTVSERMPGKRPCVRREYFLYRISGDIKQIAAGSYIETALIPYRTAVSPGVPLGGPTRTLFPEAAQL